MEGLLKKGKIIISLIISLTLISSFYFQAPKIRYLKVNEVKADNAATSVTVANAAPGVASVSINAGADITPVDASTVNVAVTGQLSDNNGCADITAITARVYLDSLDTTCSAEDNSCYLGVTCSTNGCDTSAGSTDTASNATCTAALWFHANPETWTASILVTDSTNATTQAAAAAAVTMNTARYLDVTANIPYGSLVPGGTTAANQSVTVSATGNAAIDCSVRGTAMTSAASTGTITEVRQKYSLSDDAYASLTYTLTAADQALDTVTPKPTTHPTDSSDITYWGLNVLMGTPLAVDYLGANTFTVTPPPFVCGVSTVSDGASKVYNTVAIGSQCWMAENLDYDFDDSGDNKCSTNTWVPDTDVGWCGYYTGGPFANEGLLYQWSAAMATNLCPTGWHIPTHDEWTDLERTACAAIGNSNCDTTFPKDITTTGWRGQSTTTAEGEGSYLAGNQSLWTNGNIDHNGVGDNDFGDSGLAVLPAGFRDTSGNYGYRSSEADLWSSTQDGTSAWNRYLYYPRTDVYRLKNSNAYGFSVRCLRD